VKELEEIEHHTIAQKAAAAGVQNPRGDLVENKLVIPHMNRVAGIGAPLIAGDRIDTLSEDIDDFSLPLIAPLAADDHCAAG